MKTKVEANLGFALRFRCVCFRFFCGMSSLQKEGVECRKAPMAKLDDVILGYVEGVSIFLGNQYSCIRFSLMEMSELSIVIPFKSLESVKSKIKTFLFPGTVDPIASMYGIFTFTYIYHILPLKTTKCR